MTKHETNPFSVDPSDWSDERVTSAYQELGNILKDRGLLEEMGSSAVAMAVETESPKEDPVSLADILGSKEADSQLDASFAVYNEVVDLLNQDRKSRKRLELATQETFEAELTDWLTPAKVEYIKNQLAADRELKFTLVATPNVTVTGEEFKSLAKDFGQNQPYETYITDLVGNYDAGQLSGTDPANGNQIQFSLVPSKYTPELNGTIKQQTATLKRMQKDNPDLRVPSPLEAQVYLSNLRQQGHKLDRSQPNTFDLTYIRHFDLPTKRFHGVDYVLDSFVGDLGQPRVDFSGAGYHYDGRFLVG